MILETLNSELYTAQKAKDTFKVSVLRYLLSAIKNREIELRPQGKTLNDVDVLNVIRKQIKQREESIEEYKKGNREDLVHKESTELDLLKQYLK